MLIRSLNSFLLHCNVNGCYCCRFDEQLQRYLLEPEDIRGRRNDENEQEGQSLSLHSKSLNECINSLEEEIIKLR